MNGTRLTCNDAMNSQVNAGLTGRWSAAVGSPKSSTGLPATTRNEVHALTVRGANTAVTGALPVPVIAMRPKRQVQVDDGQGLALAGRVGDMSRRGSTSQ